MQPDRILSVRDPDESASEAARLAIHAEWIGRLRWAAVIGQLTTILFVAGPLGVPLPVASLLLLVGVTLASNVVFRRWIMSRRAPPTRSWVWGAVLGALLLLDLIVLTAMLALTGGPTNPFAVFYFVNLALSGIVLSTRWAWFLSLFVVVATGLLACWHKPVESLQDGARLESLSVLWGNDVAGPPLALWGMWIAYAALALLIVYFVTRVTRELQTSNRLLRLAERRRVRAEKLEALGVLAAGAAHELATPLSTIAVAVVEVQHQIEKAGEDLPGACEDLRLARRELDRCRTILDRMACDSGQAKADAPELFSIAEAIEETLAESPERDRIQVEWAEGAERLHLLAPRIALEQALRALLQNALDATAEIGDGGVRIRVDRFAGKLRVRVHDRGPGMPPEVLGRAGEPFFTTKSPGKGMGLGLFLARSVVERLGGTFRLESEEGEGTRAVVLLPLAEPREVTR